MPSFIMLDATAFATRLRKSARSAEQTIPLLIDDLAAFQDCEFGGFGLRRETIRTHEPVRFHSAVDCFGDRASDLKLAGLWIRSRLDPVAIVVDGVRRGGGT